MLTKQDLENLRRYEARPDSPVLSVYLHLERSNGANAAHAMLTKLRQMLKTIEQALPEHDRNDFYADTESVLQKMSAHQLRGQSVAIFCDVSENFWRIYDLNAPVRNQSWWEETPHVRPLLELIDEYERFGVILSDKTHTRLFTVFLGEIEEQHEAFAAVEVKHGKTLARDRLRSQSNMQRKSEMHAQWHLKHVAEMMDRLVNAHGLDRLVLAGPVAATGELRHLLPKRLRSRVVGALMLPVQATAPQVLQETLKIEEKVERAAEIELVDELLTAAAKKMPAFQGLLQALKAVKEKRIWQLVYAEGFNPHGKECLSCSILFPDDYESCTDCGGSLRPLDDLIERMAEKVIATGGKTEMVRGVAAQRLQSHGGMGAFLRY
jgi:peptide chain release factor subunit 1